MSSKLLAAGLGAGAGRCAGAAAGRAAGAEHDGPGARGLSAHGRPAGPAGRDARAVLCLRRPGAALGGDRPPARRGARRHGRGGRRPHQVRRARALGVDGDGLRGDGARLVTPLAWLGARH